MHEDLSDIELLHRWQAGEADAGRELLVRHFAGVLRFLAGRVGAAAEDLAQQTFLAALEARDRIQTGSSTRAYLFGIAKRKMQAYRRTQRPSEADPVTAMPDADPSASTRLADNQAEIMLLRALRTLPEDLQLAVELYYWEGLGVVEVAEVLDIPAGTVKSRLWRARQELRNAIQAAEGQPGSARSTNDTLEAWVDRVRRASGDELDDP